MPPKRKDATPSYGRITSVAELGALCRAERQRRRLTLAELYETTALSTRFLSEFERGKEHVSVGRVLRALQSLGLDVVVLPRARAERLLRALDREGDSPGTPP
ncbi:MAG: helix-turn-helix domain-containing protein [Myxococcales bacterium]|nr:helix-turn-helix domain-containing protein [Myxococcales bacterium]